MHIDDSGADGAELEADLEEELPESAEDEESVRRAQTIGGRFPSSTAELEFEPKTIAFEDAKVQASEKAAHSEESSE